MIPLTQKEYETYLNQYTVTFAIKNSNINTLMIKIIIRLKTIV